MHSRCVDGSENEPTSCSCSATAETPAWLIVNRRWNLDGSPKHHYRGGSAAFHGRYSDSVLLLCIDHNRTTAYHSYLKAQTLYRSTACSCKVRYPTPKSIHQLDFFSFLMLKPEVMSPDLCCGTSMVFTERQFPDPLLDIFAQSWPRMHASACFNALLGTARESIHTTQLRQEVFGS